MSNSEANTISMETYKDVAKLSEMHLYNTNRLIKPKGIIRFDSAKGDISVDFVLVTKSNRKAAVDSNGWNRRSAFEKRINEQGLLLDEEVVGGLRFVKIHASNIVLRRYCEILKLRMPIKKQYSMNEHFPVKGFDLIEKIKKVFECIKRYKTIDPGQCAPTKYILRAEYSRGKSYLFDEDDPDFFSTDVRTLVIDFILSRGSWGKNQEDLNCVGIQRLLDGGVYTAAYPLHDGELTSENSIRHRLYAEWAMMSNWNREQPIDQIKEYLGVKYAFYFTWLGFYTYMLIPATILGLIVILYGFITYSKDELTSDICKEKTIIMCPLCTTCKNWDLSKTCTYAWLTYLFYNDMTVVFAFAMSIWATLYLELWKRYSAAISHRWGFTEFTFAHEHPRPQYLARLAETNHTKVNVVTGTVEPSVPLWKKIFTKLFSISVTLLLIVIAIATVFSIMAYQKSIDTSRGYFDQCSLSSKIFAPSTAAIISLVCIKFLNWICNKVAIYLTEMELPRTQTEFEESLIIKNYLFQFVNYYSSIIYIAFWKVITNYSYPNQDIIRDDMILKNRQEECGLSGYIFELGIQLFIIMVGEQTYSALYEIVIPEIINWITSFTHGNPADHLENLKSSSKEVDLAKVDTKRWIEDYKLSDCGPKGLFSEYLEMVMQYGLITLFVTAFPLGPLCALVNNVFEIRLDARKMLKNFRRPIPHRVRDIGVWYQVLDILGKLGVITNAFIIAFASDFVPRMIYELTVNKTTTKISFLNFTLAHLDIKDLNITVIDKEFINNSSYCSYKDYRNPPWSQLSEYKKYDVSIYYYEILAARLFFIVIFQNAVSLVKTVVQWLIPDVPNSLSDRIKRESFLTTEMIIKNEAKKTAETELIDNMFPGLSSLASLHTS